MPGLIEVIFTKRVFRFFTSERLAALWGRCLLWGKRRACLLRAGCRYDQLEDVPKGASAEDIAGHVQWAAYGDIEGQNHHESAEAKQQAPNQPQGKRLIHRTKCDPVSDLAQPQMRCFSRSVSPYLELV
jgi:hypothetical protein